MNIIIGLALFGLIIMAAMFLGSIIIHVVIFVIAGIIGLIGYIFNKVTGRE